MAYRDDDEATKLRIAELETELTTAHETIARLKGHIDERGSDEMADFLEKERLHVVRELDFKIDEAGVEAIAEMLRQRLPKSQVAEVGRTLTCRWNTAELHIARYDDRTELRVSANNPRSRALNAIGGFGFSVLGAPIIAGLLAAATTPWSAVVTIPLIVIAGYLLMDKLTKKNVRNARTVLKGAFESTIEIAKDHQQKAPVRIAVASTEQAAAEAEAEAVAEAEAAAVEAEDKQTAHKA